MNDGTTDSPFYWKDYAHVNKSTLSGAWINEKKKKRQGMGLDRTLMPKELSSYIFFLSSSFSSPPLEKGEREMFDQCV